MADSGDLPAFMLFAHEVGSQLHLASEAGYQLYALTRQEPEAEGQRRGEAKEAHQHLVGAIESIYTLLRMYNVFAQGASGQLRLEFRRITVRDLLAQTSNAGRVRRAAMDSSLEVDKPSPGVADSVVVCDPTLLSAAGANLLSSALDASHAGLCRVRLRADRSKGVDGDWISLIVTAHGEYQAGAEMADFAIPVARAIAAAHQGILRIDAHRVGNGSNWQTTLELRIPASLQAGTHFVDIGGEG